MKPITSPILVYASLLVSVLSLSSVIWLIHSRPRQNDHREVLSVQMIYGNLPNLVGECITAKSYIFTSQNSWTQFQLSDPVDSLLLVPKAGSEASFADAATGTRGGRFKPGGPFKAVVRGRVSLVNIQSNAPRPARPELATEFPAFMPALVDAEVLAIDPPEPSVWKGNP